ncbi:MAG: hypothetical protein JWL89_277 [Candidatus Saccharibacteria bacterium]|nr:hypothetical protein [Candidatus Saccharibacteria bacterium]
MPEQPNRKNRLASILENENIVAGSWIAVIAVGGALFASSERSQSAAENTPTRTATPNPSLLATDNKVAPVPDLAKTKNPHTRKNQLPAKSATNCMNFESNLARGESVNLAGAYKPNGGRIVYSKQFARHPFGKYALLVTNIGPHDVTPPGSNHKHHLSIGAELDYVDAQGEAHKTVRLGHEVESVELNHEEHDKIVSGSLTIDTFKVPNNTIHVSAYVCEYAPLKR